MSARAHAPLLPDVDDPTAAPFWRGAREGRLLLQTCGDCARPRFPPRPLCAACGSPAVAWREAAGTGRIWSFVVVHGPTLPAFADLTPFPVAVVELDDAPGVRMVGDLVAAPGANIDSVAPDAIAVGMAVAVEFLALDERVTLPVWRPVARSRG
jgi:uncharacterized OB-fold protein